MDKMTEELNSRRNYFEIDDGHEMKMMPAMKPGNRGSSGAEHMGRLQAYVGSDLADGKPADSGADVDDSRDMGVGSMPMRTVGSMADNAYGADLRPDAINRIARFDADSDSMDIHRLLPRNASEIL